MKIAVVKWKAKSDHLIQTTYWYPFVVVGSLFFVGMAVAKRLLSGAGICG